MHRTSIISLLLLCLAATSMQAQTRQEVAAPKWAAKAQKSIVSVLAYDQNRELLHSGTGIYVDAAGTVVADYELLREAYSATVVDMDGKQWPVECILGADYNYNLVRLRTQSHKSAAATLASPQAEALNGERVYALAYAKTAQAVCPSTTIAQADTLPGGYIYLTLATAFDDKVTGSVLFAEDSKAMALVQSPLSGKSYAMDLRYALSLNISAIPTKSTSLALQNIHIRTALPQAQEEALVYLYFQSRSASNDDYLALLNEYIATWPQSPEGYNRRTTILLDLQRFDEANADLQTYLKLAEDKMVAHSNAAQTIYTKLIYQPEVPYEKWSFALALEHVRQAQTLAAQRVESAKNDSLRQRAEASVVEYQLQEAQILMADHQEAAALDIYNSVNAGPWRSAGTFYAASLAYEAAGDTTGQAIILMDSVIACLGDTLTPSAAQYVLRRAKLHAQAEHYRQAVLDYNLFASLSGGQLSASFYYDRALLEQNGRMYQQAVNDLSMAISLAPRVALYHVEKSGLLLRVGDIDGCIAAATDALALDSQLTDAYRIRGYAYLQQDNKTAARADLEKAVALGDETAQQLINSHLQ